MAQFETSVKSDVVKELRPPIPSDLTLDQIAGGWLEQSRDLWPQLLSAHAVAACPYGTTPGGPSSAAPVDSALATECICPDCTGRMIDGLMALAAH